LASKFGTNRSRCGSQWCTQYSSGPVWKRYYL
jgi:hypothetical protein